VTADDRPPVLPRAKASARLAGRKDPAPQPRTAAGRFARKDGAPPPPKASNRHGMMAVKSRIMLRGLAVVDTRTRAARDVLNWRRGLIADLGGASELTAARAALVEIAVRSKLYLDHVDAYLLERSTLLGRKSRRVLPLVEQRRRMADSLTKTLVALGLDRRGPSRVLTPLEAWQAESPDDGADRA
jgi:hypothetical protein